MTPPPKYHDVRGKWWTRLPAVRLSDEKLAFILNWPIEEVRARFASARVTHRRYLYDWRAVRLRLTPAAIAEAKERVPRIRTSKLWLSGYPALMDEWDAEKNGEVVPLDVAAGSSRRYWWKCRRAPDHEWRATPSNRTRLKNKCPFCQHKKVSATNSLASRAPNVASEWHPTKNGILTPNDVTSVSAKSVWWKCSVCAHTWRAVIGNRTGRNSGCPPCALHRRVARRALPGPGESLEEVAPHLASEWNFEKNFPRTPQGTSRASSLKVWWRCSNNPRHQWQAPVVNRSTAGSGCPHCRLEKSRAPKRPSYEGSIAGAFPVLAAEWHPTKNGNLTPRDIGIGSAWTIWWRCSSGHTWSTQARARAQYGRGCSKCKKKQEHRRRAAVS